MGRISRELDASAKGTLDWVGPFSGLSISSCSLCLQTPHSTPACFALVLLAFSQ